MLRHCLIINRKISSGGTSGNKLALLPDGKIVANIEGNQFTLLRLNADGSVDNTFGGR